MRDIWGRVGRTGGGEDDDRHVPSGRGRRPSFRDDGRNLFRENLPSFLSKEVVDRDQSVWYGCDDSGWSVLEQDAIGGVCLVGSDCGGGTGYLYPS